MVVLKKTKVSWLLYPERLDERAKHQLNVRQGTWELEFDQFQRFPPYPWRWLQSPEEHVLFGNAIKQPGLEPRRKTLPSRNFAEKERALLCETLADAHLFVNIRWIGEFGGANNSPTAVNTHAAIPGTHLLRQSRKSEWCSLLYSPKNLNIILFNDSVLPDRMLKLEDSFTWKLLEEWVDTLGVLSAPNQI